MVAEGLIVFDQIDFTECEVLGQHRQVTRGEPERLQNRADQGASGNLQESAKPLYPEAGACHTSDDLVRQREVRDADLPLQACHAEGQMAKVAQGPIQELSRKTDHGLVVISAQGLQLRHPAEEMVSNRSGGNDMVGRLDGLLDAEQLRTVTGLLCRPANEVLHRKAPA